MYQKKRITIRDVAGVAGVSTQTVSRVLNNHPDVAPETYARVQQVIKETGYAPNMLARSLIIGRSHVLGVVAYGLEYFGPSRVLTGIEQQAADMGYSIFLNLIRTPQASDIDRLLNHLFSRQVDGIVWAVPEIGDNLAWSEATLHKFPVPILLVSGMDGKTSLPLIRIDNYAIGRMATEHLISAGARKIGIITGPVDWWEAQQRKLGWQEALAAHGLDAGERWIAAGDWNPESGEQGFTRMLAEAPDLDAVFASNDQMALGVMNAAHRLGIRIPEDLMVVGVDNIPESAYFWPSLTTVRQPIQEAGALAVQRIDALIGDEKLPWQNLDSQSVWLTSLQPELIPRESTRPKAASLPG